MKATVGFKRACRSQDGLPLGGVDGTAHIGNTGQKDMIFDVENTGGLVGAF